MKLLLLALKVPIFLSLSRTLRNVISQLRLEDSNCYLNNVGQLQLKLCTCRKSRQLHSEVMRVRATIDGFHIKCIQINMM